MRRSFVVLPSIAIALVLAIGGSAATATSGQASAPRIVCPLHSTVVGPPCCGPIVSSPDTASPAAEPANCCPLEPSPDVQPICCGTVVPCSTVSISASPNPADGQQQVTVSGSVTGGTAGSSVDLWEQQAGATTFSNVVSSTIESDGTYSLTAPGDVHTDRQWYVTSGTAQSSTITEQVAAGITLLIKRARRASTVHGAVTPSHAGEKVLLQRKVRGKWVTLTQPKLSKHSTFRVHYVGAPRIKATLRVVFPGDSKNMRSVSSAVTSVVLPGV
jgi:hypothetical protein